MPWLEWKGKDNAVSVSSNVPYRVLEYDAQHSYGNQDTPNLLIYGDNLDALKALLPYYGGQVKCICIDPPYNTQNAFEHYDDKLEHSTWLSLLYPRMELLRKFLTIDGTIWINIDDDEGHYLKVICDEIFGRENFVNNVIWEKKYSPQNDAKWLSDSHDHILCYARNKAVWRPYLLPRTEAMDKRYKNPDNDPRGAWKPVDLSVKTYSDKTDYPVTTPSGKIVNPPKGRCWSVSIEKLSDLINDNRIWFGEKGSNVPSLKTLLTEVQEGSVSKTIWYRTEVGDNQEAKREVKEFDSKDVFATPKPERMIQRILQLSTQPGDLVMDSFLGSATTAAVAHKMKRRWVGIEMGSHAISHCVPRLHKVIEGEQGGISKSENWQGGGGYRFYHLGEPIFTAEGSINPNVKFDTLASHIWFAETGTPWNKTEHSPMLGICNETAYYLLFNGILGDKSVTGGNVLTSRILNQLTPYAGKKIIYGEASRFEATRLKSLGITFKQIPYDIKAR